MPYIKKYFKMHIILLILTLLEEGGTFFHRLTVQTSLKTQYLQQCPTITEWYNLSSMLQASGHLSLQKLPMIRLNWYVSYL